MDDLINEFITETVESISVLDGELVNLERNPEDAAILGNIFRIAHTIKGTCGFLGLSRLESLAHAAENVLGKIRDKVLVASPQAVSLILESLDSIKGLIDYLSQHGQEQPGDDAVLIARLNQFAEGGNAAAPAKPAEAPAPVADNPFPHFRGDDMPEVKALEAMMVQKPVPSSPSPLVGEGGERGNSPVSNSLIETPLPNPPPQGGREVEGSAAAANQSIRVNLDVLENMMQTVSELVLTRNQLLQIVRSKEDKEFMTPLQQLSHITTELQDSVMKTRMQPIGNAWSKFPRLVRDLSHELGKKIELKMVGAETELDRQLLEAIKDPLTHMVRNSCDHGLETPEQRKAAGKSETGSVTLSAYHEGGHIIIDIIDDGRGIPIDKIKKKALDKGLATEAQLAAMTDKQIAQFIFAAGFSTAEQVTSVSGRGVGMDVVKTNIQKIGGAIDLDSTWGKGSKVSVKIPLTLAIVSVLLVEANGQKFGIPQLNVMELVRVAKDSDLAIEVIHEALVMRLRDKLLPLIVLSKALGFPVDHNELANRELYVAVCKVGSYNFGIIIDRVYDTEEIVVKPVSDVLKSISVYAGNTILGDGSIIMILDPGGLARMISNVEIAREEPETKTARASNENMIGFLLFSTGRGAPKAVPLELISRLEEIEVKTIECADDYPVVQYRGELMRLITMDKDFAMPDKGVIDVIVLNYDQKVTGLVVHDIIDIVYAPLAISLTSQETRKHGYLGSMVIAGKSTDVVDVGHLLADFVEPAVVDAKSGKQAKDCRVLLVEDSPFFRNLTVPLMASAGYRVDAVESAQEALSLLANNTFDMIVTDIEMPGMNGFEFASTCRNNPKVNGIPIVAYTATLSNDVIKRSKAAGINDCIVKTDRPGLLQSMSHYLFQGVA